MGGGSGFDTVLVAGTPADDRISGNQTAAATLTKPQYKVNIVRTALQARRLIEELLPTFRSPVGG